MAVATRAELKHDIDFINKQAALREGGPMDRQDRRQFKLNLKHEKRYEEEKKAQMEANRNMAESLGDDG